MAQSERETERPIPPEVSEGVHHPGNSLNDLTGKEWLRFTKSWFIHDGEPRTHDEILHPAKFPETMVMEFVKFFTKAGETALDPFVGTGSTLVACRRTGRNGIGIELSAKYAAIAKRRSSQTSISHATTQTVIVGDSREIPAIWKEHNLPLVDFGICSPPYWSMLGTSRGGVLSTHRERRLEGLDTVYSEDDKDLGNIRNYDQFVQQLVQIFGNVSGVLREGRYLVIIAQNLRDPSGRIRPLAWDIANELDSQTELRFQGERIWCQDSKQLGIWGYPKIFVPNYHHHYCLIFQKRSA